MTIRWPKLPPVRDRWDGNPLQYLSHALGHEGENSLMSELIRQDLAVVVMAGPATRLQDTFSGFYVDITLTEKGVRQYEEVIRLTFAQINKFKQQGAQDHYIVERKVMGDIGFAFQQPKPAKVAAAMIAQKLDAWRPDLVDEKRECVIEQILYKQYAARGVKKEVVEEYLGFLTPRNCYVIHRNKQFAEYEDLRTEPIYNSQYRVIAIAEEKLDEWAITLPRANEKLAHPLANKFVPKTILQAKKIQRDPELPPSKPVMLRGENANESNVWFKQDDTFDQPYVWAKVQLISTDAGFPENRAAKTFIVAWIEMFKEQCRELNYTAE